MSKHLYLVLLITFVTGFASGLYVYFLTRNSEPTSFIPSSEAGYEITATTYGGCERVGCSSIHFTDDGTYSYLVSEGEEGYQKYEDVLSSRQQRELTALIDDTPFTVLERSVFTGTCPSTYDGLAYRFIVRYQGNLYDLDSCYEALDGVPLFEELVQYFDIMDSTYGSY